MPSQKLARPAHPERIALALNVLAIGGLLLGIGAVAPSSGRLVAGVLGRSASSAINLPDVAGAIIGFLGALACLVGFVQLSRRDDAVLASELGTAGRWMVFGGSILLAAAGALAIVFAFGLDGAMRISPPGFAFSCLAVEVTGGSVAVIGIRRVLAVLGQRSRRYRAAAQAKQSSEALAAASALFVVMALMATILPGLKYEFLGLAASVLALVTGLVLIMGLLYFMLNCWWIARAIRQPPPPLESVVHLVRGNEPGESAN